MEKVVDPNNKYEHFFEFEAAEENKWARPLIQIAAGDESDDEPVYVRVNRDLRDGKPDSEETTVWVTKMREAMWHLPLVQGTTFRGTRLTPDRIEKYYPLNKLAVDAAFVSTSLEPSTAFNFAKPGVSGFPEEENPQEIAAVFVVKGKTGRSVSQFAWMHSHEQEILFANGTPMTVVSKSQVFEDDDLGKSMVIVLSEQ